jgi:hypothetical protein
VFDQFGFHLILATPLKMIRTLQEYVGGVVTAWLRQNPDSGLLIRQLPIPGVDTKWLGTHRAAVTSLAGAPREPEHLGLRERELLRAVAILDPELRQGLPRLLAASDQALSGLNLIPSRVLVVENLQTLKRCPTCRTPRPCSDGVAMQWRWPSSPGCAARSA